jgi:hypothetical protein
MARPLLTTEEEGLICSPALAPARQRPRSAGDRLNAPPQVWSGWPAKAEFIIE